MQANIFSGVFSLVNLKKHLTTVAVLSGISTIAFVFILKHFFFGGLLNPVLAFDGAILSLSGLTFRLITKGSIEQIISNLG